MMNFEQSMAEARNTSIVIGMQENEALLDFLDRLTLLAERAETCCTEAYRSYVAALEACAARSQLGEYRAIILARIDQAQNPPMPFPVVVMKNNTVINSESSSEISPSIPVTAATNPEPVNTDEPAASAVSAPEPIAAEPANAAYNPDANSASEIDFISDAERVKLWAQGLDGNEFAEGDVIDELGIVLSSARTYLYRLVKQGVLSRVAGVPGRYVCTHDAVSSDSQPAAGSVDLQVPEESGEFQPSIREARTLDERAVLERMGDGALYKVDHLIHWLQIGRSRVERATNGLCQAGLIGRRGELFVVIPQDFQSEAAS